MKKQILGILLCISMCIGVTGCGKEAPEETTSSSESAATVDNHNIKSDSSVIAVGKTTVSYAEYRIYDYFMKNQYEDTLGTDIWQYNESGEEGSTIGQEAIESVLRLIIQVKVINKEAAIEEVALGTDEREEADHNAKEIYDSLSDEVRTDNGIDLSTLTRIFEENKLAMKMYNIEIGKLDLDLTEDQIKAARVQLIALKANDSNKTEKKALADQIYEELQTTDHSFYTIAKEYTEEDEIECLIGGSDSRTNLSAAVLALTKGQISSVIEETDGYYIAYCLETTSEESQEEYRNEIVEEKQTEGFQKVYDTWADQFDVKVSKALLAVD